MSDLELIVAEIMRIDGCEKTKLRAIAVLRSQAGRRVYLAKSILTRPMHVKLASDLLKEMDRNEVRDALMSRLRVSRDVAYALIRQALNVPRCWPQRGLF